MSVGIKVSSPAALAVIVCFFLPWFTVSCSGTEVSRTGYELAVGAPPPSTYDVVQDVKAEPVVFGVVAAALLCLVLSFLIWQGVVFVRLGAVLRVLLAAAGLTIIFVKWGEYRSDVAEIGAVLNARFGIWGSIIGLSTIALGGVLDLLVARTGRAHPYYRPPPY